MNEYDEIRPSRKRAREDTDTNTEEILEMMASDADTIQDTEEWVKEVGKYEKEEQIWEESVTREMERVTRIKEEGQEKIKKYGELERERAEIRSLINRKFHKKLQRYPAEQRNKTLYDELARAIGEEIIKEDKLIRENEDSKVESNSGYERLTKEVRKNQYKRQISEMQSLEQREEDHSIYEELRKDRPDTERKVEDLNIDPEMEKEGKKDGGKKQKQPSQKRAIYTVKFPGAKPVRIKGSETMSD